VKKKSENKNEKEMLINNILKYIIQYRNLIYYYFINNKIRILHNKYKFKDDLILMQIN
jgi:hypothetical protein